MTSPQSWSQQRCARCRGEIHRGSGIWPLGWSNGRLEPPFEPFDWSDITRWDLGVNGFDAPYQGEFGDRLRRLFWPLPPPSDSLYSNYQPARESFFVITVGHYADDEVTYPKAEQLILALGSAKEHIAFELFGVGESSHPGAGPPRIEPRFAVGEADISLLEAQLHTLYPRSAVVTREFDDSGEHSADREWSDRICDADDGSHPFCVAPLCLAGPYCHPIRTFSKLDNDPLASAIAILEELQEDEWAVVQVLFSKAMHPWAENLRMACQDPYLRGKPLFEEIDPKFVEEKLRSPLYATSVHLAASNRSVRRRLESLVHQYQSSANQLIIRDEATWRNQWKDDEFPAMIRWQRAIGWREPLVPGMLLNARELAGLMHLPSPEIPSERLLRVKSQTRQPPVPVVASSSVVIGENIHRGQTRQVAIPPDIRARHCYIPGASGTGKSTLLLNMILQDIATGHGVGLLDPHGDLVKVVLRRIPENRIDDVILFDASDTEYPFALNILESHDETELDRIVAETIMSLERYFPASWGPRLERILQYTLRTVLHAVSGATLADVEQMLTDPGYRDEVLAKTTDPRLLQFWTNQFKFFPKNATDPVLNKLSVFLLDRHVRNIICQRRAAINFDVLLNEGKILLANLSTGLLTEKVAGTLGSFLVTKIVNAAFRRASLPEPGRRPWFLYVDEFQNFMNLSVGFERILAEARKYRLVLAGLANQYVGQLSQGVKQAIFGNVETLIAFRLGVEDAQAVAKELGVFTASDIVNLQVGQAIARVGTSQTAFNLQTFREPPAHTQDPTQCVVALARRRYARPRREVEAELVAVAKAAEKLEMIGDIPDESSDPNEDDLVR